MHVHSPIKLCEAVVQTVKQGAENKAEVQLKQTLWVESLPCDQQATAVSGPQTPCKNNYIQPTYQDYADKPVVRSSSRWCYIWRWV